MDQELRDTLHELQQDVKKLLPLVEAVDRHERALYGNGHTGLVESVTQLRTTARSHNAILGGVGAILTGFIAEMMVKWFGGSR